MFGYIKPFTPELRMREFDTYKAVYCGLCKTLGKRFGQLSRLTLNYDFTFLALVAMSIRETPVTYQPFRCHTNPTKRRKFAIDTDNEPLAFAASAAMVMFYYKVKDTIADSRFFKKLPALCILPFAKSFLKKANAIYPKIDEVVSSALNEQAQIERERIPSADRASEPTALALSGVMELLSEDAETRRILSRLGYLIGRYIYLSDALDDIEEDLKQDNYNPFVLSYQLKGADKAAIEQAKDESIGSIYLTIGEIGNTFDLLNLYQYQPILSNIIHQGLRNSANFIRLNKKEKQHERSL